MKDEKLLGPWVRRFLLEHLVTERNLSQNTQASYRDALVLLLPFVCKQAGVAVDRLTVEDLSPAIIRTFLEHLERDRQCSGVSRNQRLATIHSLARFIGMRSPVHLAWCAEVRSVPFKKTARTVIEYLEKVEMDALLNQPDQRTRLGARDHTLLLFLYNSGARAEEAAKLTIAKFAVGRALISAAPRKRKQVPDLSFMVDHGHVVVPLGR
jgi:integrase/recombinase XerD